MRRFAKDIQKESIREYISFVIYRQSNFIFLKHIFIHAITQEMIRFVMKGNSYILRITSLIPAIMSTWTYGNRWIFVGVRSYFRYIHTAQVKWALLTQRINKMKRDEGKRDDGNDDGAGGKKGRNFCFKEWIRILPGNFYCMFK